MMFDPFDPAPTPAPTATITRTAERIVPSPHNLPKCSTHQTWDDACGSCASAQRIRAHRIDAAHQRHAREIMRTDRYGR